MLRLVCGTLLSLWPPLTQQAGDQNTMFSYVPNYTRVARRGIVNDVMWNKNHNGLREGNVRCVRCRRFLATPMIRSSDELALLQLGWYRLIENHESAADVVCCWFSQTRRCSHVSVGRCQDAGTRHATLLSVCFVSNARSGTWCSIVPNIWLRQGWEHEPTTCDCLSSLYSMCSS